MDPVLPGVVSLEGPSVQAMIYTNNCNTMRRKRQQESIARCPFDHPSPASIQQKRPCSGRGVRRIRGAQGWVTNLVRKAKGPACWGSGNPQYSDGCVLAAK